MIQCSDIKRRMTVGDVRALLRSVPDPEIPVLNVVDLGVVRNIAVLGTRVDVSVAPTYTACPATEVIERMIIAELEANGLSVKITRVLSPPWTTDWISDEGREKLAAYGISPPGMIASKRNLLAPDANIQCPRCSADDTSRVSEFGSTPCKASYKCNTCLEPFEYFKCL